TSTGVYFRAWSTDDELWRSDGTDAGTRLLTRRDRALGTWSSNPQGLIEAGSQLFFTADDNTHGRELWASDGSSSGTRLVLDIAPGFSQSFPTPLAASGATLYFSA